MKPRPGQVSFQVLFAGRSARDFDDRPLCDRFSARNP